MLTIKNLSKNFGQKELFRHVDFSIFDRERVCLIAPNGSGKTTLLNMILKKDLDYDGSIEITSGDLVLAIAQKLPDSTLHLFDFVTSKLPLHQEFKKLQKIEENLNKDPRNEDLLTQYGEQLSVFERHGGYNYLYEAKKVLEGLSFKEEEDFYRPINTFSGGEMRRALLVEVLIQKPDLLILDEPTNHLDLKNILFLENFLKRYSGTVFFVSHDTEFIDKVATHTVCVENFNLVKVKGGYQEYIKNLEQRRELFEKKQAELQDQIDKLKPNIEKFKAGTRSTQAQSMQKRLDKLEEELSRYEVKHKDLKPLHFRHRTLAKPFNPVLNIHDFNFQLENRIFFKDLELVVERGEKIAILAPNGTGKTLLISQMIEAIKHKSSKIEYGQGLEHGYFVQEDKTLAKEFGHLTALQYLEQKFKSQYEVKEYHQSLSGFHLKADRPIETLSGGEQSKLRILTLLLQNCNFLILDEPTNHMDIEAIEGISRILQEYKGTLIIVTHNRKILRDLEPHVYLLQEQKLKSMHQETWEDIFNTLMYYETRFDAYEETSYDNPSVAKELKKLKEEDTQQNQKPKFLSKEIKQEIRKIDKQLQQVLKDIETEEVLLTQLKGEQAKEEIYTDYQKAKEVQDKVLEQEKNIENLYLNYTDLEEQKKILEN